MLAFGERERDEVVGFAAESPCNGGWDRFDQAAEVGIVDARVAEAGIADSIGRLLNGGEAGDFGCGEWGRDGHKS
jgi:hypothetical protein